MKHNCKNILNITADEGMAKYNRISIQDRGPQWDIEDPS